MGLIRAVVRERHDPGSQVCDVVLHPGLVHIVQNLGYEIHRRLGARMNFLLQVPLNELPETFLGFNGLIFEHFLLHFLRKPTGKYSNWNSITPCNSSSERSVSSKDLNLNSITKYRSKNIHVPFVVVMEMDACLRLAEFSVGSWPLASCFQILLQSAVSINLLQIEINNDHFFRRLDEMELLRINV